MDESNRTKIRALLTDTDVGLTLATVALNAKAGSEKRQRNQANARKAYDTITRGGRNLTFAPEEREELDDGLAKLKSALQKLGESF